MFVIENDLLVSKAAMNLCILQFLPRRFWFKDQALYRRAAPVFVTPSVSRVPEISDFRNFSGSFSRWIQCPYMDFSFAWAQYWWCYRAPLFRLAYWLARFQCWSMADTPADFKVLHSTVDSFNGISRCPLYLTNCLWWQYLTDYYFNLD